MRGGWERQGSNLHTAIRFKRALLYPIELRSRFCPVAITGGADQPTRISFESCDVGFALPQCRGGAPEYSSHSARQRAGAREYKGVIALRGCRNPWAFCHAKGVRGFPDFGSGLALTAGGCKCAGALRAGACSGRVVRRDRDSCGRGLNPQSGLSFYHEQVPCVTN